MQNRILSKFSKRLAAGAFVAALAAAVVIAPLSVYPAEAEVVPIAKGAKLNQKLMAQATENAEFKLQDIEVKKVVIAPAGIPVSVTSSQKTDATPAAAPVVSVAPGSAQAIAAKYVGDGAEFSCLVALWNRESHWNVSAANPSGAYGIPQALPGSKMASAGADWQTNPDTQIRWGLGYIQGRYGSPCAAWAHSNAVGWY